jgi:hypothetical protein
VQRSPGGEGWKTDSILFPGGELPLRVADRPLPHEVLDPWVHPMTNGAISSHAACEFASLFRAARCLQVPFSSHWGMPG